MNSDIFTEAFERAMEELALKDIQSQEKAKRDTIRAFNNLTGRDIDSSSVNGNRITLDDGVVLMTTELIQDYKTHRLWAVQGYCPKCNSECWSENIFDDGTPRTLARIGEMIVAFKPSASKHTCGGDKPKKSSTWQTRLAAAINDAIQEMQED